MEPTQLFDPESCLLLVIDLQDKLLPHVHEHERVVARSGRMIEAARIVGTPILLTEQYPKGLGPTTAAIRELLGDTEQIVKTSFGCFGEPAFVAALRAAGAQGLVVVGIEAHVCVCQTVLGALAGGFVVHVVRDAVSSRCSQDAACGLERMQQAGAVLVTSEMQIFEWVRDAASPTFKQALPLVR